MSVEIGVPLDSGTSTRFCALQFFTLRQEEWSMFCKKYIDWAFLNDAHSYFVDTFWVFLLLSSGWDELL